MDGTVNIEWTKQNSDQLVLAIQQIRDDFKRYVDAIEVGVEATKTALKQQNETLKKIEEDI